jgi:adenylate kinase family enzyme
MREYEAKTAPVIGYYERRGTRVEYVNGDAPIDTVTDSILTIFGPTVTPNGAARGEVA